MNIWGLFLFTDDDLIQAVRIARGTIEKHLGRKDAVIPGPPVVFENRSGVFVTLNTFPGKGLRGCIGFPEPVMQLKKALPEVAVSAATRDPRFPRVTLDEMSSIVIDVTILTPPEEITYGSQI